MIISAIERRHAQNVGEESYATFKRVFQRIAERSRRLWTGSSACTASSSPPSLRRGVQLKRNAGPNLGLTHDTMAEAYVRLYPQTTGVLA
jgi:hypothetical protein